MNVSSVSAAAESFVGPSSLAAQGADDTATSASSQSQPTSQSQAASQNSSSGESVGEEISAAMYGLDGKILAAQKQVIGQLFSALA